MAITATGTSRGPTRRLLHAGVAGLLASAVLTGCLHGERVSTTSDGTLANGASRVSSISTDGRYVAFGSDATNLYPGDTNGHPDLFIRDNVTGKVELAAVRADGKPATAFGSGGSISDDGRYVTYTSSEQATPDDTDSYLDTFVHDRFDGTTVLASRPPGGIADDRHWGGVPSANGRFVVVHHSVGATWVYDVAADTAEMVTTGSAFTTVVSDDGNIVALVSPDRLTAEDTNSNFDVYVFDLESGTIDMLNQTMFRTNGYLRHGSLMFNIDITPDGRHVAYARQLYNDPGSPDAYVYDRVTDTAEQLPEPPKPETWWAGDEFAPTISDDGRYVAYAQSLRSELADRPARLVVHDRENDSLTVVEDLPNSGGTAILISGDGRYVTFGAVTAEDSDDTNGVADVFVRYAHRPQVATEEPAELGPGTHEIVVDATETYGQPAVAVTGGGVTVGSVTVEGKQLRLEITVVAGAAPGPRGLLVTNDGSWPGRPIIGGTGLCNGCIVISS